jgi:hypothetical protein
MYYDSYNRPRERTFLQRCSDYWWVSLIVLFLIVIVVIQTCTEERKIGAIVLEHNVVGHKNNTEYSTLIRTDDGRLMTVKDLNSYVVPVNGRVYITRRGWKK